MLFDFFFAVRKAGVPASVKEFLTLLEAMDKGIVYGNVDDFYTLSRLCLVKDEAYFDRTLGKRTDVRPWSRSATSNSASTSLPT